MKKIILCKFGEIALKGANRAHFEKLLKVELKKRLRNYGRFKIYSAQSTVYIEPLSEDCDMDSAYRAAKNTFGISAIQMALEVPKDMEQIIAFFERAQFWGDRSALDAGDEKADCGGSGRRRNGVAAPFAF